MNRVALGFGVTVVSVIFAACGGSGGSAETGGMGGASTGSGGSSGKSTSSSSSVQDVGSGFGGTSCNPACEAPKICSAAGTCIAAGTCTADSDCATGTVCDMAAHVCAPGGGCGAYEATIKGVPPNLLVVLDRSCSMTDAVGGKTKWSIAVAAVDAVTKAYAGQIRFGLTLFPDLDANKCGQGVIPVPVGANKEKTIQMMLDAALVKTDPYYPDNPCVTNIDSAMQQAATEPSLGEAGRESYALLLTDGAQSSCSLAGGDTGTTKIIKDLAAKKVSTFVVGFGGSVDAAQLNIFADAGGVPSGDPKTKYYKAEDQASLDAVLGTIAKKVLSCSFTLDKKPTDPAKIFVFFNNDPAGVQRDPTHAGGWDYDEAANTVTFYGQACKDIKSSTVSDVDVVLGCGSPTPL
jgi:von Willebrand factor type A domain